MTTWRNPFVVSGAVPTESFIGRDADVRMALSQILTPGNLAIYGIPQMGKSSLLRYLADQRRRTTVVAVDLDCGDLPKGPAYPSLPGCSPDDPAMVQYTSGTTGQPKGALHGHRVLIGHFPGVETHHDFFPHPGDRIWTPADWAWAGGLLNVLLPGLHYGVPVVARRYEKFDPEEAFALMARAQIRNAFIPPTALRMLRAAPNPTGRPYRDRAAIRSATGTTAPRGRKCPTRLSPLRRAAARGWHTRASARGCR